MAFFRRKGKQNAGRTDLGRWVSSNKVSIYLLDGGFRLLISIQEELKEETGLFPFEEIDPSSAEYDIE